MVTMSLLPAFRQSKSTLSGAHVCLLIMALITCYVSMVLYSHVSYDHSFQALDENYSRVYIDTLVQTQKIHHREFHPDMPHRPFCLHRGQNMHTFHSIGALSSLSPPFYVFFYHPFCLGRYLFSIPISYECLCQ